MDSKSFISLIDPHSKLSKCITIKFTHSEQTTIHSFSGFQFPTSKSTSKSGWAKPLKSSFRSYAKHHHELHKFIQRTRVPLSESQLDVLKDRLSNIIVGYLSPYFTIGKLGDLNWKNLSSIAADPHAKPSSSNQSLSNTDLPISILMSKWETFPLTLSHDFIRPKLHSRRPFRCRTPTTTATSCTATSYRFRRESTSSFSRADSST